MLNEVAISQHSCSPLRAKETLKQTTLRPYNDKMEKMYSGAEYEIFFLPAPSSWRNNVVSKSNFVFLSLSMSLFCKKKKKKKKNEPQE